MELVSLYGFKFIIAGVIAFAVLGLFGVGVLLRLRIIAAMAVGIVVLGFFAWSAVKPEHPLGAITVYTGDINLASAITCMALAFVSGVVAYFACWPLGLYVGPLAAPAGLAVWSLHSGDMSSLIAVNNTLTARQDLYSTLKLEGFFWFAVVAAGYCGVLLASKLAKDKTQVEIDEKPAKGKLGGNNLLTVAVACGAVVLLTHFAIGILAQDVRMFDAELGSVTGQPEVAQIAFAVLLAFGLASFLVKRFLETSYVVSAFSTAIVTFVAITISSKPDVLSYMVTNWPVAFFPRAASAILPIQIVSFGVIGSVAGYWTAVEMAKHKLSENKN
jgi:hypothetical protein